MSNEVQIALINNAPTILTALGTLIGAIFAGLGYIKSHGNGVELKQAKEDLAVNTAKTEEVGKAVNGRMSAFIEELKAANDKTLAEAVKAAVANVEKIALTKVAELKTQLAMSQPEVQAALSDLEKSLVRDPNVERRAQP